VFNPFQFFDKIFKWYSEGISKKAKILISLVVLFFLVGVGFAGYKINDYFENDPNACKLCHVHDYAHERWAESKHRVVTCHECHHSTKREQVVQLYRFVFLGQKTVEPRHGKIIVPSKLCMGCHWEENKKYPQAANVSGSRYHAKHVFIERIECTRCHGYVAHKFLPEERFCTQCHTEKEVHGIGMEKLACINCHTDRTEDLKPDRKKCLFCHGPESIRKELIEAGTIDVKYFKPSEELIKKATKINAPDDAPMQFKCYECHKPHAKIRPDYGTCTSCHPGQERIGKHEIHIKGMNMKCIDCHKPHIWTVKEAQAKKECTKCHEYKDPAKFLS
jgi:nitrate reductase cytochrome c-type subunit